MPEKSNSLVSLTFESSQIRSITRDGEPWFVAADVCRVLGIKDTSDVAEYLEDYEKDKVLTRTLGGPQNMLIVSESGLYTIMLRTRDAVMKGTVANKFKNWVTQEVLPSIRKTGQYTQTPTRPDMDPLFEEFVAEYSRILGYSLEEARKLKYDYVKRMWDIGHILVRCTSDDPAMVNYERGRSEPGTAENPSTPRFVAIEQDYWRRWRESYAQSQKRREQQRLLENEQQPRQKTLSDYEKRFQEEYAALSKMLIPSAVLLEMERQHKKNQRQRRLHGIT